SAPTTASVTESPEPSSGPGGGPERMSSTSVLLQLVGSVALLLWGVRMVRTGMSRAFGTLLRRSLANGTKDRFTAFGMGLGVTALRGGSGPPGLIASCWGGRTLSGGSLAPAMRLGAEGAWTRVGRFFSTRQEWIAPAAIATGVFTFLAAKSDRVRSAARIGI